MALLYTLSNIMIPFVLLIYSSLKRISCNEEQQFGKWALLLSLTFIFNIIFTFFDSNILLFIDFTLKILVFVIPHHINQYIEVRIRSLHLQIFVEDMRCKLINRLLAFYTHIGLYILRKLDPQESEQFRQAIIHNLSSTLSNLKIKTSQKYFEHTGVNCTIIVETKGAEKVIPSIFIPQPDRDFSHLKAKSITKEELKKEQIKHDNKAKLKKIERDVDNSSKEFTDLETVSIKDLKQSTEFRDEDFEEEKPQLKQNKKNSKKAQMPRLNQHTGISRRNTDIQGVKTKFKQNREKSLSPDSKQIQQQAKILQKLDLSVSQYSEMFDEDRDEEIDEIQMTCKVQAIVEIGSSPNTKLQIYNLQLYSNDQLRIVSLYNREFERHKLLTINKLPANYYELGLEGGAVNKRKVKFRGQFQPFKKYMI